MLCQKCQAHPATIHSVVINGNQKTEQFLCEECAAKLGHFNFTPEFAFNKLISQFLSELSAPAEGQAAAPSIRCPVCGFSLAELAQNGNPRCPACYDTFAKEIAPLLRKIHGTDIHRGRLNYGGIEAKEQSPLAGLKARLAELVAKENFEEAAAVRDQIRALEQEQNAQNKEQEDKDSKKTKGKGGLEHDKP